MKAQITYRDFLTLWKDADPDIPVPKEAKVAVKIALDEYFGSNTERRSSRNINFWIAGNPEVIIVPRSARKTGLRQLHFP